MNLKEKPKALLSYLRQQTLPFETTSVALGKVVGYKCSLNKNGKENDCSGMRGILRILLAKGFIKYEKNQGKCTITWVMPSENSDEEKVDSETVGIIALPVKSEKIVQFHPKVQVIEDWELCDIDDFPYVSARFAARKLEYEDPRDFIRIVEACIERGQITEDQFVCYSDKWISNPKVSTINNAESFGRPVEKDYYLSEEGLCLAIMECRKSASIAIKRQIAKVFVAWRHGKLSVGPSVSMTLRMVADIIDKHEEKFVEVKQDISAIWNETDAIKTRVNVLEKKPRKEESGRRFSKVQEDIACQLVSLCHYCGEPFDASDPELKQLMHHIKPWQLGGQTIFNNLAVIHKRCSDELHRKFPLEKIEQVRFPHLPLGFAVKADEKLEKYYAEKRKRLNPDTEVPDFPGMVWDVEK